MHDRWTWLLQVPLRYRPTSQIFIMKCYKRNTVVVAQDSRPWQSAIISTCRAFPAFFQGVLLHGKDGQNHPLSCYVLNFKVPCP